MKTYLSIDLDYWNGLRKRSIDAFFSHVFQLGLPIWVAPFHDQLVPHINEQDSKHNCDTLINVDYHSDIADWDRSLLLREGTWANFVEWRQRGTFIWRYPHPSCCHESTGYCHWDESRNPFTNPRHAQWHRCIKQTGLRNIPWHTIKAVGVSLSIAWINRKHNPLASVIPRLGIQEWLKWDSEEQKVLAKPFMRLAA